MTELILIRHGQSLANINQSTDPDCALSDLGVEQARTLARRLAGFDLSGFIGLTSPYCRAIQTAQIIAESTGLRFTTEPLIREWGPTATASGVLYPQQPAEKLVERLREFLVQYDGRKVVAVSHAAPIAALIPLAWGETPNMTGPFWEGVSNCSIRWVKSTCT